MFHCFCFFEKWSRCLSRARNACSFWNSRDPSLCREETHFLKNLDYQGPWFFGGVLSAFMCCDPNLIQSETVVPRYHLRFLLCRWDIRQSSSSTDYSHSLSVVLLPRRCQHIQYPLSLSSIRFDFWFKTLSELSRSVKAAKLDWKSQKFRISCEIPGTFIYGLDRIPDVRKHLSKGFGNVFVHVWF